MNGQSKLAAVTVYGSIENYTDFRHGRPVYPLDICRMTIRPRDYAVTVYANIEN